MLSFTVDIDINTSAIPERQADMSELMPGVYRAERKDKSIYYRSSLTYRNRHISLGSFETEPDAHAAYTDGCGLLADPSIGIDDHDESLHHLSFEKWVILCNFRDNEVYFPNPIYVRPRLFYYYFAPGDFFIFSGEDLFYYSAHRIQRRGGHCFVADYGSQINILSRYGIRSHAIAGKDYIFLNGNHQDMQYSNIKVINPYHGVRMTPDNRFAVRIHVRGYLKVGIYKDAIEAAIAYNKAADILRESGTDRNWATNYIDGISPKSYADIYTSVHISSSVRDYAGT